ncbi:hypothetical protein KC901_00865 [Patescibacteria group bacterium]|nr:hypothetical protein [Patescibacteria group bacterium]
MNKNITIVLDLDMLLTQDSDEDFLFYLAEIKKMDQCIYNALDVEERRSIQNEYQESGRTISFKPTPGAREVLSRLKKRAGFNITFFIKTDRNELFSQRYTDLWVQRHYADFIKRAYSTQYRNGQRVEDKAQFCVRKNAHVFVDDHWGHVSKTAKKLPHCLTLLYTQNRNKDVTQEDFTVNIERVFNWKQIYKKIILFLETQEHIQI